MLHNVWGIQQRIWKINNNQSHQVLQLSCFTEKDIHMLYIVMLFSNSRFQLSILLDMTVKQWNNFNQYLVLIYLNILSVKVRALKSFICLGLNFYLFNKQWKRGKEGEQESKRAFPSIESFPNIQKGWDWVNQKVRAGNSIQSLLPGWWEPNYLSHHF